MKIGRQMRLTELSTLVSEPGLAASTPWNYLTFWRADRPPAKLLPVPRREQPLDVLLSCGEQHPQAETGSLEGEASSLGL